MTTIRVYELARELNVDSKALLDVLEEMKRPAKNHMSSLDADVAEAVRRRFTRGKAAQGAAAAKQAAPRGAAGGERPRRPRRPAPGASRTDERAAGTAPGKAPAGRAPGKPAAAARRSADGNGPARPAVRPRRPEPGSRGKMEIPESILVKDLAGRLGVPASAIIKFLMNHGVMVTINQPIPHEVAARVATRLGFEVVKPQDPTEKWLEDSPDDPETLKERPPVVTVLGHVDHGKTSLLDALRETRVAASEAGGITQHIGAYQVELNGRKITFIDTPGHEAFAAMRARGAQVTDVAVLVVAADDGVMPQTVEAINHAKAANVPIIVAVNKMDLPQANMDRVLQGLSEHGLVPEAWGGDTVTVPVSALKRQGLDDLLEMILLVADMQELKANPDRLARGIVIESELDRGRGPVATVLIQKGTLRVGDAIVAGAACGRVRAMFDHRGESLQEAGPSTPVLVLGLSDAPPAGEVAVAVPDDRIARELAEQRRQQDRDAHLQQTARTSLDDLFERIKKGEAKELPIIIKADGQGTAEALRTSLEKLGTEEVQVNVIHTGVGGITETDVNLAIASGAIIIGFHVRPDAAARRAAERENVDIRLYRVIYEAIDDVRDALSGLLEPEQREVVLGRAEVRATFRVPNVGVVAGCYVTDGMIARNAQARVIRDGVVVYEGPIGSLKRFKDDVREVTEGYECGIGLERFNDIKEGDVIEAFRIEEVPRQLARS